MEKKRKDSISGQMRLIGRMRDWRKKSFVGLGFFARKRNPTLLAQDEMDDIEILEQLVHEQVHFDWDEFENQREKSMFVKQQQKQQPKGRKSQILSPSEHVHRQSLAKGLALLAKTEPNFKEIKLPEAAKGLANAMKGGESSDVEGGMSSGEVQAEEDSSSDNDSLPSIIERPLSDDLLSKITGEGKEKLRFIMEFAKGKKGQGRNYANPAVDFEDPRTLTKSRLHSRASRSTRLTLNGRGNPRGLGRRTSAKKHHRLSVFSDVMEGLDTASVSSVHSGHSQSYHTSQLLNEVEQYKKDRLRITRLQQTDKSELQKIEKSKRLEDQFAKYKGFRNAKHMKKHLERLRGFEELRNETQIDLMARENGYRPARNSRVQSVLSHLDEKGDLLENLNEGNPRGKDKETGDKETKENVEDAGVEDDEFSDSESEVENDEDVCKFMDMEGDDLLELVKEWDKVEGFNKDRFSSDEDEEQQPAAKESEQHSAKLKTAEERAKKKARRRKQAIRRGWARTKKDYEKDFVQRRNRPYDSLTMSHLKDIKFR